MTWTQNYDPFGSPCSRRWWRRCRSCCCSGCWPPAGCRPRVAALAGLAAALLCAIFVFTPARRATTAARRRRRWAGTVLAAAGYGAAFGLLPIGWIVLAAIFLYTLTVETGQFEIVKHSVAGAVRRPPHSGAADRLLLRRVRRRGGRLRHAGGHLGGAADRGRLPAAARRRAGADRQHLPGRLRRAGHADHHAGQGHRPGRAGAQRAWPAGNCRSSR